jgi:hypothetical protein
MPLFGSWDILRPQVLDVPNKHISACLVKFSTPIPTHRQFRGGVGGMGREVWEFDKLIPFPHLS